MTRDDWTAVKTIAADALALPLPERRVYVTNRCGSDALLLGEVQSLLESIAASADLYEHPIFPAAALLTTLAESGEPVDPVVNGRIGPYRVLSEIGRGGMGAAYLAVRDDDTFEKRVAIKLIKRGMDTDAILRRFRHERQILANLEHPNIVTLLDGGTTPDGRPYFVMEYVDGVAIDVYCDAQTLTVPERLKLFLAVCGAVQHAHEQRVIHRDLKPSNILVTKNGVPKLLDFGIAKLLDPARDGQTFDAVLLAGVMTPQYSSPEQIRGEPATAASDVYSLGMLLYVLLAGRVPYRMSGAVRASEPPPIGLLPPPSAVVDEAASRVRGEGRAQLRRRLSGDPDAIALTALHTEPAHRYPSVQALADDVHRHLDGRTIAAKHNRLERRLIAFVRRTRVAAYAAPAAVTVLVTAAALIPWRDRPSANALGEVRSIAVLPLSCAAADDLEYLCDGIAEDVSRRLSRVPRLRVIARDSSYHYKDSGTDALQIGRELGADAVLLGTAVRRGAQLAVAAELVDARDRRRLWAERFEHPIDAIHGLPHELTEQVVARVRPQFTAAERAAMGSYTPSAEAYQAYLRGRFFWNKRTPEGLRRSIEYFRAAVAKDPSFARAHAGVADALMLLTEYHTLPATETYREAKAAVARALEIDDTLAAAHTSRAYLLQFYEWNWPEAEAAFRRALALDPNYATAHQWYAEFLSASGRHDEALSEIRTAIALDPVSLIVNSVEANLLYMAGRFDDAIAKGQQVLEMDPNFPEVYEYLKRSYDQKGLFRQAIAARQARRRLLGRDVTNTPALAAAAAATDPRDYWRNRLKQEIAEARAEGLYRFEMAELLAQAGDTAGALDWLERSCQEHDFMMSYIRVAPNLQPLHREPRYQRLLRRGCPV